jgi:hypothetical protein
MSAIPLRLGVIEAIDPNWRTDRLFDKELYNSDLNNPDPTKRIPGHANGLEAIFNKMTDGVQCAAQTGDGNVHGCDGIFTSCTPDPTHVACADIHTGLSRETTLAGSLRPITQTIQVFKSQVIEQMPVFETRSVIDKLHFYVSHAADLTEAWQRVPVAAAHNLCLDVQSGSPFSGTPVVLAECKPGSAGQTWVYDRENDEIYNPDLNKCLRIQDYVAHVQRQPVPKTPVLSANCGEDKIWSSSFGPVLLSKGTCTGLQGEELKHCQRYQQWTYDPKTQVLSNAFGMVLDVQWGTLVAGTPIWIWERNDTPAQKWYAEPRALPCVPCLAGP